VGIYFDESYEMGDELIIIVDESLNGSIFIRSHTKYFSCGLIE